MTTPHHAPPGLPAAQARRIPGLLGITEALLSAPRARGERGDAQTLTSLEELAALLTGGGDASQLISAPGAAQRGLAALMLAASPQ